MFNPKIMIPAIVSVFLIFMMSSSAGSIISQGNVSTSIQQIEPDVNFIPLNSSIGLFNSSFSNSVLYINETIIVFEIPFFSFYYAYYYNGNLTNILPHAYSMHISYSGMKNSSLVPDFILGEGNNTSYIPQIIYNGTVSSSRYSLGPHSENFIDLTLTNLSAGDLQNGESTASILFAVTFFNGSVYFSYNAVLNLNIYVYKF